MQHFESPRSVIEPRVMPHSSGGRNDSLYFFHTHAFSITPLTDTLGIRHDENEQHHLYTTSHKLYSILPRVLRNIQNTTPHVDVPSFPSSGFPHFPSLPFPFFL